jgi:pSer/pThr/pTyr-binding forkhead associated (FHA) protein
LRDERSANGTFVNGQQIEDMSPHVLRDNDHVGIGEHELLFRPFASSSKEDVADMATINIVRPPEVDYTWRTHSDDLATVATSNDEYGTHSIESEEEPAAPPVFALPSEPAPAAENVAFVPPVAPATPPSPVVAPPPVPVAAQSVPVAPFTSANTEKAPMRASEPAAKPDY